MEVRLLSGWLVEVYLADGPDRSFAHFLCNPIYHRYLSNNILGKFLEEGSRVKLREHSWNIICRSYSLLYPSLQLHA